MKCIAERVSQVSYSHQRHFQGFRLENLMFPFPYNELRLVHDEKVCDAMERARIDTELARGSRRTAQLFLLRNVLVRICSRLNIFARTEHLRRRPRALAKRDTQDSR